MWDRYCNFIWAVQVASYTTVLEDNNSDVLDRDFDEEEIILQIIYLYKIKAWNCLYFEIKEII